MGILNSAAWTALLLLALSWAPLAGASLTCEKGELVPVGPAYDYCLLGREERGSGSAANTTASLASARLSDALFAASFATAGELGREQVNRTGENVTQARSSGAEADAVVLFRTVVAANASLVEDRNATRAGEARSDNLTAGASARDPFVRELGARASYDRTRTREGACTEGVTVEVRFLADGARLFPRTGCRTEILWAVSDARPPLGEPSTGNGPAGNLILP